MPKPPAYGYTARTDLPAVLRPKGEPESRVGVPASQESRTVTLAQQAADAASTDASQAAADAAAAQNSATSAQNAADAAALAAAQAFDEAISRGVNLLGADAHTDKRTTAPTPYYEVSLAASGLAVGDVVSAGLEGTNTSGADVFEVALRFLSAAGATLSTVTGGQFAGTTQQRRTVEAVTIPASTAFLRVLAVAVGTPAGSCTMTRASLTRGPVALPWAAPPSAATPYAWFEDFGLPTSLRDWQQVGGTGSYQRVDTSGDVGRGYCRATGEVWLVSKRRMAYDPAMLYRLRVGYRVNYYGGGSSPWPFYFGLVGYDAAGTIVNPAGAAAYNPSHYVGVNGEAIAFTAGAWVERTGWVKGTTASPVAGASTDPLVPRAVHTGIVEVAPLLVFNVGGPPGAISEVDFAVAEGYDADAAARLYTAVSSSGAFQGGTIAGDTDLAGGDLFVPGTQIIGVGTAGAPDTLSRTYRLPHSAFVPKDLRALQDATRTNGQLGTNMTGAQALAFHYGWLLAAPGVTLTRITARLYRDDAALDFAVVTLLRGTTTLATLTHTGTGWLEVQAVLAEPVTATTVYELAVDLRSDNPGINHTRLAWIELEYERASFADTV